MEWLHVPTVLLIAASGMLVHWLFEKLKEGAMVNKELLGDWYSAFETNDRTKPPWNLEKIRIYRTLRLGTIRFETIEPIDPGKDKDPYWWKSRKLRVVDHKYLCGTWKSTKDPNSKGVLISILHTGEAQTYLLGAVLGPNKGGTRNLGKWVMWKARAGKGTYDMKKVNVEIEAAKRELRKVAPSLEDGLR